MIHYLGHIEKKPSTLIIENFYSEDELRLIWRELEFLTDKNKLKKPIETGSATKIDNVRGEVITLKENKSIFLDDCYLDRSISDILKINRKIFYFAQQNNLEAYDPIFRTITKCDSDQTLISYYENDDYYLPHSDKSILTVLSYFIKNEEKILGGELVLNDFNLTIPIKNNMLIVIPGIYQHEVKKIKMDDNAYSTFGRYSMSQFLYNKK